LGGYNRLVSLAILRVVLISQTLAVLTQSVFAGEFLAGSDSAVKFHEFTGWTILALAAVQIGVTGILMRSGSTSLWLFSGSFFVFLAAGLQVGTGYGRFLNVHIPLGVIIFGAVTGQTIAVFSSRNPAVAPTK
jgi:hypothetical protein